MNNRTFSEIANDLEASSERINVGMKEPIKKLGEWLREFSIRPIITLREEIKNE